MSWRQLDFRFPLKWRHNERDCVSNHRRLDCLLNRYSSVDQRRHQSSASLAFVRGTHRWPLDFSHKGPVVPKMLPFDNVITSADSSLFRLRGHQSPSVFRTFLGWSPGGFTQVLTFSFALRWRHNERDSVSNHQPHDCLLNRLFRRRSKKTSKLRVTGFCVVNSPGTGEFTAQMVSNAENISNWWRHHGQWISSNLSVNEYQILVIIVAFFTKEINSRLAKPTLEYSGDLA